MRKHQRERESRKKCCLMPDATEPPPGPPSGEVKCSAALGCFSNCCWPQSQSWMQTEHLCSRRWSRPAAQSSSLPLVFCQEKGNGRAFKVMKQKELPRSDSWDCNPVSTSFHRPRLVSSCVWPQKNCMRKTSGTGQISEMNPTSCDVLTAVHHYPTALSPLLYPHCLSPLLWGHRPCHLGACKCLQ